jgi:hypothetical protein
MDVFPYPPDQDGYNVTDGPETISVDLDGGAPFVRRDQLGTYATVICQWTLGPVEFAAVRTFYKTTTVSGSLPFLIDLIVDSPALTRHKAYFKPSTFKLNSQSGLTYVVGATLLVNPTVHVS